MRLASALSFKNFIRRNWVDEEGNYRLAQDEVVAIKKDIIGLMITVPANIQSQLGDAVSVIADSDFFRRWDTLVDDLVSKFSPDNSKVNNGVLQVAHSIFKRWRPLFRSDELFTEIVHVLERFTDPYLQLLTQTDQLIDQNLNNAPRLHELLATLNLLIKLMYDLSCQDLPPKFEDNLSSIASFLQKYLAFAAPALGDDDDEAGSLEYIKAGIFEVLSLWTLKYGEDFGTHVGTFVGSTWNLLTTVGSETKYDVLVSKGLQFLTSICGIPEHARAFDEDSTLSQVIERVVLPNVSLRETDLELFEDEPIEFIRRDLEGSDNDTRRRAATDFLRGLLAPFEQRVTQTVYKYIDHYLAEHTANPSANWRAKDTAVYLFSAIAAKGAVTARDGVKTVNPLVNVLQFFQDNIAADLLSAGNSHPILAVDAIKYLYVFRSQMNRDQWRQVLPPLVQQLASDNYVIYTYAAISLERALALRGEDSSAVIDKTMILPSAQPLVEHLFKLIESQSVSDPSLTATKFQENEFLMRCVMRVLTVIKEGTESMADVLLEHLIKITGVISLNPSNPRFCYYHFESLGALVRYGGATNQQKLESSLQPPFGAILQNEIQDFIPYVFQLFAALLENKPAGTLPDFYKSLIEPILKVDYWQMKGYVPALTRLLTSMIIVAPSEFASVERVESVLGIFKHLLSLKSSESFAFELLECILANLPISALEQYIVAVFRLVLERLEKSKSDAFQSRFIRLYHFISARQGQGLGTDFFIQVLDQMQKELIVKVYMGVVVPNTSKLTRPMDRKIAVISLAKTLGDSEAFADKYMKGWTTTCNLLLELLINPPVISRGDDAVTENDVEDAAFGVGFTPLVTIRRPQHDYWPEVENVKVWVGDYLRAADGRHNGRIATFVQERLDNESRTALLAVMQAGGAP